MREILPKFVRYYNRLEIKGIENLPKKGSAIIAPNHSGGLDLDNFTIMSLFDQFKSQDPKRKKIWLCYWDKWAVEEPSWAPFVQKFSPIPINLEGRGIPYEMVDKIVDNGELIAIMPEGHSASIKEGYRLWKFYPGVIRLHIRYKIPIIPTACIGFVNACPIIKNEYDPSIIPPWKDEVMLPIVFPVKLKIVFGKPIIFKEYENIKIHEIQSISKDELFKKASIVRKKVKELIEVNK